MQIPFAFVHIQTLYIKITADLFVNKNEIWDHVYGVFLLLL